MCVIVRLCVCVLPGDGEWTRDTRLIPGTKRERGGQRREMAEGREMRERQIAEGWKSERQEGRKREREWV